MRQSHRGCCSLMTPSHKWGGRSQKVTNDDEGEGGQRTPQKWWRHLWTAPYCTKCWFWIVQCERINKMTVLYRILGREIFWGLLESIGSSTEWVCCTECWFWLKLVNLNTSTKWVNCTECWFWLKLVNLNRSTKWVNCTECWFWGHHRIAKGGHHKPQKQQIIRPDRHSHNNNLVDLQIWSSN